MSKSKIVTLLTISIIAIFIQPIKAETFRSDTVEIFGKLIIFDKLPDSMTIAINSAEQCNAIAVIDTINMDTTIEMMHQPATIWMFNRFEANISDVNKTTIGDRILIELMGGGYYHAKLYSISEPLYCAQVLDAPISKRELLQELLLNIRIIPNEIGFKNRYKPGISKLRVNLQQNKQG